MILPNQMNELNSKSEKPRDERRYDPELLKEGLHCDLYQCEMLNRCSDRKDTSEWNQWRKKKHREPVLLQGADLNLKYLKKVDLQGAHLEHADLQEAHLEGSILSNAHLQNAKLGGSHLENAILSFSFLQGANFQFATMDGLTQIEKPEINRKTIFTCVALDRVRIDPATKQLLEYIIRRKNWEDWYKFSNWFKYAPKEERNKYNQFFLKNTIGLFWAMSDYGISTKRIILTFCGLAGFFAAIYSNLACWLPPGIVSNLEIEPHLPSWHYGFLVFLRPIYFSVVTMTTLGFGDMYANAQSIWGHILLTFQVILGYVLLGALVTRFAVLFTAGGPAGKFADDQHAKTVA